MTTRHAHCSCGQFEAETTAEPLRVSVCHCHACQLRTGSVFGAQARFAKNAVTMAGRSSQYVAIPVGAFAHPGFPAPQYSFYESRRPPLGAVAAGYHLR
ncbi:MAG TPA: GFA family protein [Steroidobacteraceae bacterium]|jgi:hypothetical protein|nr:GFA family protein [Steroidobacteraceae bacterium]